MCVSDLQHTFRLDPYLATLRTEICDKQRIRVLNPIAQQRPRVPRIDDFLNAESLGRAEWRAVLLQSVLDFAAAGRRIGRGLDLAAIGGLYTTFDGQRSPVARRPGVAQVERLRVAVSRPGHSINTAEQDRNPWNGRLIDSDEGARAGASRALAFGGGAHEKARIDRRGYVFDLLNSTEFGPV